MNKSSSIMKFFYRIVAIIMLVSLSGCLGYAGKDIEVVGQIKRIVKNTPLICSDFIDADLSMGVMRNGTGSVSKEDIWIVIDIKEADTLRAAMEHGDLVKITYNLKRVDVCTDGRYATSVEVIDITKKQ